MSNPLDTVEEQVKWENVRLLLYLLEIKDGEEACVGFLVKKIETEAYKLLDNSYIKYHTALESVVRGLEKWLSDVPYFVKAKESVMAVVEDLKSKEDNTVYMSVPIKVPVLEEKLIMLEILTNVTPEEMKMFRQDVAQMRMSERFQFVDQVIAAEAARLAAIEKKPVEEILLRVGVEAKKRARSLV